MKFHLSLLLMVVIAVGGTARADSEVSFLKAGDWYQISGPKGEALPGQNVYAGDFSTVEIKILKLTSNQWCWVEYDQIDLPKDSKGQVVVFKARVWLNFSHVTTVQAASAPDYKSSYSKQYAGGVKVVPYSGT